MSDLQMRGFPKTGDELMLRQFAKYCAVGASGIVVNGALYFGLLFIGVHNTVAWLIGVGSSVFSNFILNKFFVFKK